MGARTALVTGGTGGIGSAVCRHLARKGYAVVAVHHPAETEQAVKPGRQIWLLMDSMSKLWPWMYHLADPCRSALTQLLADRGMHRCVSQLCRYYA